MAFTRISITLPRDVLAAADRRARALDRSRSWLIVEALRAYLATPARSPSAAVREPDAPVYVVREVADARRQHLAADLKRSPAERLRRAEALARVGYGFASEWAADEILKRPITVIGDDPAVDVFTVAWKVKYEQAAPRAEVVDVEGVRIPLIALDDLIETKRTGRLQDAADIEVLEEIRRLRG